MSEYPVELNHTGAKTLMWANEAEIEPSALQQLKDVSELPGLHGLRVMPDVHWGNGATVGSVIAMEQALAPAAVGVDIGCGVNAVRTSLKLEDFDDKDLHILRGKFENIIPVGFNGHENLSQILTYLGTLGAEAVRFLDTVDTLRADLTEKRNTDATVRGRTANQLGTLGGGNHFIELTTDSTDTVWITLHSGSRNIGKSLAERHIKIAKADPRNEDLPKHLKDLSLFFKGTPEMDDYLHDLQWAQRFAMLSRSVMMALIQRSLYEHFALKRKGIFFDTEINCHHNYVAEEMIDGKMMVVTRKGAISAKRGELALIPGSMATGSYIVRGLGNDASFQSASHGAGRRMSRTAAKKTYTVEDLERTMVGIEARTDEGVLDEISLAYKDLDSVIAAESDLVEVVQKLNTILCVKG